MAELPDPTSDLSSEDRSAYEHMAAARSHSDGRHHLGEVYVRMFNNPGVARAVGALGEHLRFHGVLPDDVRELAILRFSSRRRLGYEWAHHQRPARLAGLDEATIAAVTAGEVPTVLPDASKAVVLAVDAVVDGRSIPAEVQAEVVAAHGDAGIVEVVAVCGLYALMGDMVTAFDIPVEDGFPTPPF
ncbi:MAG: carboxymuconolactone decarboxylase family protein [Acidimicrobiales bacterium]